MGRGREWMDRLRLEGGDIRRPPLSQIPKSKGSEGEPAMMIGIGGSRLDASTLRGPARLAGLYGERQAMVPRPAALASLPHESQNAAAAFRWSPLINSVNSLRLRDPIVRGCQAPSPSVFSSGDGSCKVAWSGLLPLGGVGK